MHSIHFGTDGIRGKVGEWPITAEAFNGIGQACCAWLKANNLDLKVAIGWDTRASGCALAHAFAQGFLGEGMGHVTFLNITPTPAVAHFVEREGFSLGVAITASHNPSTDNGLKLFHQGGYKLRKEEEACIESWMNPQWGTSPSTSPHIHEINGSDYYIEHTLSDYDYLNFGGRKIVLDTANGATVFTSLPILKSLGLELIAMGDEPTGENINLRCGSECCEGITKKMQESGAWLGMAHDGDGDRVVLFDELGNRLDGDEVLGIIALDKFKKRQLNRNKLVVTEQSNSGLDWTLKNFGIRTIRTEVGDREVYYGMVAHDANVGGESSGHVILRDIAKTGDGLRIAIELMHMALEQPLVERRKIITLFPKAEGALGVASKIPITQLQCAKLFEKNHHRDANRMYMRYSGTENKLRFLVEAATDALCTQILAQWMHEARLDFERYKIMVNQCVTY
ncbi:MAG: hypothetical protein LBF43_03030 [Puniceicoccales bacterium]|jgi:phosphoglucosamine mutase|nr:hypothetical protein [Puniceicoccales bacterium]